MKHLLLAAYIFSVLYCYLQLNVMIDRCVDLFRERHPAIPMDLPNGWKGFKLTLEILCISAIPGINLFLAFFILNVNEAMISEIVDNVEINHWQDIQEVEAEIKEKIDLDRYF